jgi:hypothetical protein
LEEGKMKRRVVAACLAVGLVVALTGAAVAALDWG